MLTRGNENIMKCLDLSTGHLTQDMAQRITDGESSRKAAMQSEYGFLMSVPAFDDETGKFEGCDGMDDCFISCLRRAAELDCDYLFFDRDAELLEGLPAFDW